ncbi:PREDICTED: suppressor of SWI4 1 homolog [Acropora digitifera]|uniref:suppressor of SWI4 1 homolog n=1 Tax=Acropora digitifera TaxID=70779 RepID=UPI00077AAA9B|nr:PREDICTED: suppressor of SWI4 1 homolog [Acropora digitifera]
MGKSRKRKRRTHSVATEEEVEKVPHSLVIHRGHVGKSVVNLEFDLRRVMEPYTATNVKVSPKNILKDFVHIAGPLGVTHLLMFTQTEMATYLSKLSLLLPRVSCLLVNNYSLTLLELQYCLTKDVMSALKKPKSSGTQYKNPPLLVLNGFSANALPMKLMTTMFQNLFPSINIQKVVQAGIAACSIDDISDYVFRGGCGYGSESEGEEPGDSRITLPQDVPGRGNIKAQQSAIRLTECGIPVIFGRGGCGYGSESEGEEPGDSRITLPQDVPGRGNIKAQQSAIRLTELGPRMRLKLIKIEEGICSGEVLFHKYVKKTAKEIKEMKSKREEKRYLRVNRCRDRQKPAILVVIHRARSIEGQRKKQKMETPDDSNDAKDEVAPGLSEVNDDDDDDDAGWYRREVGKEPDPELFPKNQKRRKPKENLSPGKKRRREETKTTMTRTKKSKETKSGKVQKAGKIKKFKVLHSRTKMKGKTGRLKRKSKK